jgi:hypothetical protein
MHKKSPPIPGAFLCNVLSKEYLKLLVKSYKLLLLLLASSASLYIFIQVKQISITANKGPKAKTMITSKPGEYPMTPSNEVNFDLLNNLYKQ